MAVIEDNTEEVLSEIESAMNRALEKIGMKAEGYAKKKCPVDTGRLRNSITHIVDDNAVYIGTNVEYAPHVELGTIRQKAKPYLRPAAQDHASEYKSIFEREMKL